MASPSERLGRVLVTGASGFTGRHLVPALAAHGWEPVVPGEGFDLRRPAAVEAAVERSRPDCVIHLAGIAHVAHDDPAAVYAINAVGTTNLLDALVRHAPSVRKVVLASSANVYGNVAVERIAEDTPCAPINHYGCSKLSMEMMARAWYDRLPIVVTRPFNYTGPGQSSAFLIPKIVGHFVRREPEIALGNTDVARDFSDVRMVVEAYCRLLGSGARSVVLNICTGTARSLESVLDALHRITGHRPAVRRDPALIRANEVVRLAGDPTRLLAAVGELPYRDFDETLRWMVAASAADAPAARTAP